MAAPTTGKYSVAKRTNATPGLTRRGSMPGVAHLMHCRAGLRVAVLRGASGTYANPTRGTYNPARFLIRAVRDLAARR